MLHRACEALYSLLECPFSIKHPQYVYASAVFSAAAPAAAAPAGCPGHSGQAEHARVSQAQRSAHEVERCVPSSVCVAHHSKQLPWRDRDALAAVVALAAPAACGGGGGGSA